MLVKAHWHSKIFLSINSVNRVVGCSGLWTWWLFLNQACDNKLVSTQRCRTFPFYIPCQHFPISSFGHPRVTGHQPVPHTGLVPPTWRGESSWKQVCWQRAQLWAVIMSVSKPRCSQCISAKPASKYDCFQVSLSLCREEPNSYSKLLYLFFVASQKPLLGVPWQLEV